MVGQVITTKKWLERSLVSAALLLAAALHLPAHAAIYTNGIEPSSWRYEGSAYGCSLVHDVPYYGEAVFKTRAGMASSFYLDAKAPRFKSGQALMILQPPAWRHNLRAQDLGFVSVDQSRRPVTLESKLTERLLAELNVGYEVELTRMPWYGAESATRVYVSPIGFRDAYKYYLDCLADLLPVNFEQIERTAVYFGSGRFEPIASEQKLKLDNIVRYCEVDPSVKQFYIDGHTDSVGTRADNFILAENRAKQVSDYLIGQGLPAEKITVRWHGERYPATENATVEGRSQNRRVTVRLERDPALIPKESLDY